MVRAYNKTVLRMFKNNAVRFAVIAFLCLISTSVVCAIGTLSPRMKRAFDAFPEDKTVPGFLRALADNINTISFIFPVFFITVVSLVVFMTVTRLIESERAQTGTLKILGYGQKSVIFKYTLFSGLAAALGCLLGIIVGYFGLSDVLYSVISSQFDELPRVNNAFPLFGLVCALISLIFAVVVTVLAAFKTAKEKPINLLLPKSPKAGGKILLEKLPFLWKRLKFKHKSALRNIFRYKMRFFMTVLSVLFSTALVFAGFALRFALAQTNPHIMDTIGPVAALLIISAVLLNATIIYNIANINIEERKREIATLKVLGYRDTEVSGYIFRELFILTALGVLTGLPAGYGFMIYIFEFLDFGGIEHVKWYVWIFTAALSVVSFALAALILNNKIRKNDMNASLKTIE